jgi:MFS transporter, ACS family, D-galactonate transporter
MRTRRRDVRRRKRFSAIFVAPLGVPSDDATKRGGATSSPNACSGRGSGCEAAPLCLFLGGTFAASQASYRAPALAYDLVSRSVATIVALLGLSIFINYIDRGNLATASTLVKSELHLSASQLGFLLTAFFITYMPMQPVIGWLSDRFTASRVLVAGFILWSLATVLSGFAQGFVALFACRLLLGVGESVSFPTMAKILCENVSEAQRGVANGITQAGLSIGPAFGIFLGGMLVADYGWRPFFIGTGLISLLWVVAWSLLAQKHVRQSQPTQATDAPPIGLILREPSLYGASAAHFCANFVLYFYITWIPYYLVHQRHWSLPEMARIGGVAFLTGGLAAIACGMIADRLIRRGMSATIVRKSAFGIGAIGAAIGLIGCGYSQSNVGSAAWLILACGAGGILGANTFVIAQTMAGPAATGRWVGVQNTLANIAGIIAPSLTGVLVERTGTFYSTFTVAAVMAVASGACWIFLVGQIVPIDWSQRSIRLRAAPAAIP